MSKFTAEQKRKICEDLAKKTKDSTPFRAPAYHGAGTLLRVAGDVRPLDAHSDLNEVASMLVSDILNPTQNIVNEEDNMDMGLLAKSLTADILGATAQETPQIVESVNVQPSTPVNRQGMDRDKLASLIRGLPLRESVAPIVNNSQSSKSGKSIVENTQRDISADIQREIRKLII